MSIKKIQEIIFYRKLNVENKNELLVVNDYMKFMEESTYSETVKSTIINEFKI